jgi:hypothetical protein
MTGVGERLLSSELAVREHLTRLEAITGNEEGQSAILDDRQRYVADAFRSGDIDTPTALRLASYTTHSIGEGLSHRKLRLEYINQLIADAQPGEAALATAYGNCMGGTIDGPLGLEIGDDAQGHILFDMQVPFAHMPGEPRIARMPVGHMFIREGQAVKKLDFLYVGEEQIANFVKTRGFGLLRPNRSPHTYHMHVARDGALLVGLYQAGITLAECGIEDEARAALYEKMNEPFGPAGKSIGEACCQSLPQAMHVVTMDHLA